jgi:hypothetical protein
LGEEALRRGHVALLTQQRLDEVTLPVDGAVEVAPAPVDVEVRLVRGPRRAALPAPLGAQPLGQQRRGARRLVAHRRVADDEATRQEHLGQVPQTQLVAHPPEHDEQDHSGRVVHVRFVLRQYLAYYNERRPHRSGCIAA